MFKYSQIQKNTDIEGKALPFSMLLIYPGLCPIDKLISRADTPISSLSFAKRSGKFLFVIIITYRHHYILSAIHIMTFIWNTDNFLRLNDFSLIKIISPGKTGDICMILLYIVSQWRCNCIVRYFAHQGLFTRLTVYIPVVTDEGTRPSGGSSQSVIFYAFYLQFILIIN